MKGWKKSAVINSFLKYDTEWIFIRDKRSFFYLGMTEIDTYFEKKFSIDDYTGDIETQLASIE